MTTITMTTTTNTRRCYQNVHLSCYPAVFEGPLKSDHYNSNIVRHSGAGQGIEAEKAELTYSGSEGAISLFTACFH